MHYNMLNIGLCLNLQHVKYKMWGKQNDAYVKM